MGSEKGVWDGYVFACANIKNLATFLKFQMMYDFRHKINIMFPFLPPDVLDFHRTILKRIHVYEFKFDPS